MGRKTLEQKRFEKEFEEQKRGIIEELENEVQQKLYHNDTKLMCYCIYYLKIFEKSRLRYVFTEYNRKDYFEDTYNMFIANEFISELKYKNELNGKSTIYIRATKLLKEVVVNEFDTLSDLISYTNSEYVDGYKEAINQHTSLEHYHAINGLKKICERENLEFEDAPEKLIFKIENNKKNIRKTYQNAEVDLIIKYNKKDILVEVERGTTDKEDITTKLDKLNIVTNAVLIACPNLKSVEILKKKAMRWEEEYDERYRRNEISKIRRLKIMILSISQIKDKKGKKLRNYLMDFQRKDYYLK